jgi:uncharacterized damage-inducible protein DinB
MNIDPQLLLDYTIWANDRVLDGARQLSPDALAAPIREGWLSPLGVLTHMLAAERAWLSRWKGASPDRLLSADDLPTLDAVAGAWGPLREEFRAFLREMGDPGRVVAYQTTRGIPQQAILWQMVLHVFNHNTEHRSQVALVLAQNGIDVGSLDFITFVRDA